MSARPGRCLAEIAVDLPRPRSLEIKHLPAFVAYEQQIWKLLESEVRREMATNAVVGSNGRRPT